MTLTLDLQLLDAELDREPESLTIEEVGDLVGADEPGRVLHCAACGVKRFTHPTLRPHYLRPFRRLPDLNWKMPVVTPESEWALLHGRCGR